MSLKHLIAEEEGAYPDHCQKGGDGSKDGVYWGGVRGLLRDIEAIDGHIQCRNGPVPAL